MRLDKSIIESDSTILVFNWDILSDAVSLMPIASGKITSDDVLKLILSPVGIGSIMAGFAVSYIGGKGVGIFSANPTILLGVLIGTLIAVLFMKGLPAGLIIAAGVMAIFSTK